MIERNPRLQQGERFDLIVVGGGVYGAATALEASRRGLRPLLLEKGDFGAGTSANSLRILHGGLRYLQTFDPVRFRASVTQRRWWLRTFPELVRPLPCLMPLYGRGLHRGSILGPGLLLNDILSFDRNRGVSEDRRLGRGRLLDPGETIRRFPVVDRDGLKGGGLWNDAFMVSPHRLILEMLRWAGHLGAGTLNYVEVVELLIDGSRVRGVRARDRRDGGELEFKAPLVINAAGPGARRTASAGGHDVPDLFRPSLAYNVLLDRKLPSDCAVGVRPPVKGGQVYFLLPHGPFTLAGTVHEPWSDDEPPQRIPKASLSRFLSEISAALPDFPVTLDDVVRQLPGLLPAANPDSAVPARRPMIIEHGRSGGPEGLFSVSGVKFTTAPAVARQVVALAFPGKRGRIAESDAASRPAVRPWMSPGRFEALAKASPSEAAASIQSLIDEEAATSMEDLVLRRLDWGLELKELDQARRWLEPLVKAGFPTSSTRRAR